MASTHLLDGQEIDISTFKDLEIRDLLTFEDVTPLKDKSRVRLNFVGFSINQNDEAVAVFPKHFEFDNTSVLDSFAPVFRAIQRANSDAVTSSWGKDPSSTDPAITDCNFPFRAFYQIYAYYQQYGLHLDEVRVDSSAKGKIYWKKTLSQATFYPIKKAIVPFPLRRESSVRISHLITDAMVYAINHTINLFGPLINLAPIPYQTSIQQGAQNYGLVSRGLRQLRAQTFNDRVVELIDSLIDYFNQANPGSGYYFKIRNFAFVWQSAVSSFLKKEFVALDASNVPVLSEVSADDDRFSNLIIRNVNEIRPEQYVDIDHFWLDQSRNIQYVFDAKYYNNVSDLNYKQIFYTLICGLDLATQGVSTVSALILPSRGFRSKTHFSLSERFARQLKIQNSTLDIQEIYLDCRTVIRHFECSDAR